MATTTEEAPTVTWTVWLHAQYHPGSTEVWTGSEYPKALSVALEVVLAAEEVSPLNPDWTVAAHVAGESTTNSWRIVSGDDTAIVFITTTTVGGAAPSAHVARKS